MRTAFDAAYPPASVPGGSTTALIYAGGDTPNPISAPATVPVYAGISYWLPAWVRSDPRSASAATDAAALLEWLKRNSAPSGCSVVLDLETAVTASYVTTFAAALAPHPVLLYGSRSTLFGNPQRAGYFLAWPGWTGIWPSSAEHVVAIQHTYAGAYDLSALQGHVALWARAVKVPVAAQPTPEPSPVSGAGCAVVEVRTGPRGTGWTLTNIPWRSFLAATLQGSDPSVDGRYWPGSVHVQNRTTRVLVSVTGCLPNVTQAVFVART